MQCTCTNYHYINKIFEVFVNKNCVTLVRLLISMPDLFLQIQEWWTREFAAREEEIIITKEEKNGSGPISMKLLD